MKKIRFFAGTNAHGGEFIFLNNISKLFDAEFNFLWDVYESSANIASRTFRTKLIHTIVQVLSKFSTDIARIFFLYIGIYYIDLPESEAYINFVSSVYMPIPRGKNIIAYIMTPPRIFTIDYELMRSTLKNRRNIYFIIFPFFRKIAFFHYIRSLKHAVILFTISKTVQLRFKRYFGKEVGILYASIEPSKFKNESYNKVFICVSRVTERKRQDFILKAFNIFSRDNPDFKLIFISPKILRQNDFLYLKDLERYVMSNSLDVEFLFSLSEDELIKVYATSYALLFAGVDEDFGIVILEAMASEKPVIAVNTGGPTEIVIDANTGFLVDTPNDMALKMEILSRDLNLVKKMGERGKIIVKEKYSDEIFTKHLVDIMGSKEIRTTKRLSSEE